MYELDAGHWAPCLKNSFILSINPTHLLSLHIDCRSVIVVKVNTNDKASCLLRGIRHIPIPFGTKCESTGKLKFELAFANEHGFHKTNDTYVIFKQINRNYPIVCCKPFLFLVQCIVE